MIFNKTGRYIRKNFYLGQNKIETCKKEQNQQLRDNNISDVVGLPLAAKSKSWLMAVMVPVD